MMFYRKGREGRKELLPEMDGLDGMDADMAACLKG
jgi:hypothetical protein